MTHSPTFHRTLLAGLLAGLASGITANLVAAAISSAIGARFVELNPWAIGIWCVVANLGGGAFFFVLTRWTDRPTLHFAVVAVLLALLDSLAVIGRMPRAFGIIASPVHFLVAMIAIVMIPSLSFAHRPPQSGQP